MCTKRLRVYMTPYTNIYLKTHRQIILDNKLYINFKKDFKFASVLSDWILLQANLQITNEVGRPGPHILCIIKLYWPKSKNIHGVNENGSNVSHKLKW